jgi:hypothetical protein
MGLFAGKLGCFPLLDIKLLRASGLPNNGCRNFNKQAVLLLDQNKDIRTVILAARWAIASVGYRYGNEAGRPVVISPDGVKGNPAAFRDGLERTLNYLNDRGLEVIFVTQAPEIGWDVPSVLARSSLFGHNIPSGPSLEVYRERQRVVSSTLNELSRRHRFRIVDVARVLCPGQTCLIQLEGRSLYWDDDHLSSYGAEVVSSVFDGAL